MRLILCDNRFFCRSIPIAEQDNRWVARNSIFAFYRFWSFNAFSRFRFPIEIDGFAIILCSYTNNSYNWITTPDSMGNMIQLPLRAALLGA